MEQTIGILAHVDAGKTTLSEMLLLHGGTLRTAGRVDHGDTCMDSDSVERDRGVTVYSAHADLQWSGVHFHLIDTPGHTDFAPEMERTLWVLDRAVLVVSAVEGVQGGTREIWDVLAHLHVPTVIFVNKTDRAGADPERVLGQLRELSGDCAFFSPETVAERNEEYMEDYLAGTDEPASLYTAAGRLISARRLFPVLTGSALEDRGVTELMDFLAATACGDHDGSAPFGAAVWQIRRDKNNMRWALMKVTSGCLRPRMEIDGEKITELRRFSGGRSENIPMAPAGTLCAAAGLASVKAGDGLGSCESAPRYVFEPLMCVGVFFDEKTVSRQTVLDALRTLEDEEPQLHVRAEKEELSVRMMGKVQLEVLTEVLHRRFGLDVTFGRPVPVYRETISASVTGCGHFEPLRHYAEVHLRLSPGAPGSGVTFDSVCPTDALALNWQRLIGTHVLEREHPGVLTGAPLTDVRVTLLAGRAHEKHTEGGDFRQAVYRAIRQGLMQARSVLLEPYYLMAADGGPGLTGRIISDVQRMGGELLPTEAGDGPGAVRALVPAAEAWDYASVFAPLTHGGGKLSLRSGGWHPCHDPEAAVAAAAYDPLADVENTPNSVFCSHGAGYLVQWDEAPAHMHIQLK